MMYPFGTATLGSEWILKFDYKESRKNNCDDSMTKNRLALRVFGVSLLQVILERILSSELLVLNSGVAGSQNRRFIDKF